MMLSIATSQDIHVEGVVIKTPAEGDKGAIDDAGVHAGPLQRLSSSATSRPTT